MNYPALLKSLKAYSAMEKLAGLENPHEARQAQILSAGISDDLFTAVKSASKNGDVVAYVLAARGQHRSLGEKTAASEEQTAELLHKLAAAVYVDGVLSAQLEKLAGAEYDATRSVQLLGREYAVNLMRGLFA